MFFSRGRLENSEAIEIWSQDDGISCPIFLKKHFEKSAMSCEFLHLFISIFCLKGIWTGEIPS